MSARLPLLDFRPAQWRGNWAGPHGATVTRVTEGGGEAWPPSFCPLAPEGLRVERPGGLQLTPSMAPSSA